MINELVIFILGVCLANAVNIAKLETELKNLKKAILELKGGSNV